MKNFSSVDHIAVSLNHGDVCLEVGRLAWKNQHAYFEYSPSFLKTSLEISPFKLPRQSGVISCTDQVFDGLFGVFYDSLPDGWGRLLIDRSLKKAGIDLAQLNPLDRLAFIGSNGMGALRYSPYHELQRNRIHDLDINSLAQRSSEILLSNEDDVSEELLALCGSSAGARPKIMVSFSAKHPEIIQSYHQKPVGIEQWLIKFRSSHDSLDIGASEYAYHKMAGLAKLDVPPAKLFKAKTGPGYFGVQRFDLLNGKSFHVHSLAGLLHADYRFPSLDYFDVLKATYLLTKDMQ